MTTKLLINDRIIDTNLDADMLVLALDIHDYSLELLDDGTYAYAMDESTYDYMMALQAAEDKLNQYPYSAREAAEAMCHYYAGDGLDLINKMIAHLEGKN